MPKQVLSRRPFLAGALLLAGCASTARPPPPVTRVPPVLPEQAVVQPLGPTFTLPLEVSPEAVKREAEREREMALKEHRAQETRLWRVAYPLLHAAAPFCPQARRPGLGTTPINAWYYKEPLRDDARRALGLGDALSFYEPPPDSAAAVAGLRHGDRIETINGEPAPVGEKAMAEFLNKFILISRSRGLVRVGVVRGNQKLAVEVAPTIACAYELRLSESDVVNAYARGRVIYVPRGMMRFATTDVELAAVVAHEIAHLGLNHSRARAANAALGNQNAFSREFEMEADYVSLYILTLAGLPLKDVPGFWRRFAANRPTSIDGAVDSTHPTSPERFIAMDATLKEIAAKQAAGQPLRPSRRTDPLPGDDGVAGR